VPVVSHLLRREAVYYWRRKVPRRLVGGFDRKHLLMSLRTWNPAHARSLAIHLDAALEDLLVMPETQFLTRIKLDAIHRDVLVTHLAKLERVAAAEKCGVPIA
jgi:hypothetical protein